MEENNEELKKKAVSEHMRELGKKGGTKMKERGSEYFREIGRKGALKRWNKNEDNGGKTT